MKQQSRESPTPLIRFPRVSAGAFTDFVKSARQRLGLLHFQIGTQLTCAGLLTLEQLVAGSVAAGRIAPLNKTARRKVYAGLADISTIANAV